MALLHLPPAKPCAVISVFQSGRSARGAVENGTVFAVGPIERSETGGGIVRAAAPGRTRARPPATVWDGIKRNRPALFGLVVMAIVIGVALLAPWIAPYDPARQFTDGLSLEGRPLAPSSRFWLGTDLLGRDLLTRLLYGARISLLIGLLANGAALTIGTFFGAVAGYFRGWVSTAFMRLTDMMMAFPALILAIALAAILRPSMWIVALVIAMVNWVWIARIIYSQVLSVGQREFIEAARALGVPTYRIFWKHLFPHLAQSVVILLGVTVITFALLYALPADPARMIAGRSATADTVARIRSELGLDQSLPVQYARYLGRLLRGNLGRSYAQKIQVTDLLRSRLAATFWLMLGGIAFELLIGLPAGMLL